MIAAVLTAHNTPLELAEVDLVYELQAGQVLCRILVSGICGKQLGEIRGDYDENAPMPRLLGHEACVIVESTGPGVTKVKIGDKCVAHWRKGSGMDSAFPEYLYKGKKMTSGRITTFSEMSIISENRLTKVPHETPNELCALLGCAMSTALAVMENDAKLKMGESVVIVGCGGVGLNLIRVAKMMGAAHITGVDSNPSKRDQAFNVGATAFTPALSLPWFDDFDAVVDTTGHAETIELAVQCLVSGGRFIMLGQPKGKLWIPAHGKSMFDGEGKRIIASQGGGFQPDTDIPRYVNMWRSGFLKIDGIVTDRFPLSRINDALDLVRSGSAGRVLLEMV